eukprot:2141652-Rhodomonas_salina.1
MSVPIAAHTIHYVSTDSCTHHTLCQYRQLHTPYAGSVPIAAHTIRYVSTGSGTARPYATNCMSVPDAVQHEVKRGTRFRGTACSEKMVSGV